MKLLALKTSALVGAFLALSDQAFAADFFLRAAAVTNTMPDGAQVVQWGFARDSAFGARDGAVTVPGPMLVVPPGDNTLTVRLDNDLPEPISIVINGQFSTNAAVAPVRHPDGRVRSFTQETPPGNAAPVVYSWSSVRPGTYLYLSGSHPQVQVPMGLYGAMKKDTNSGVAYPGVGYSSDVVLLFSEIDPALNDAVATGNFGAGKLRPSVLGYEAKYFLINGKPFTNGMPALRGGDPGRTNLIRFLNASLETHVPVLNGAYLRVIAEDGNPRPYPLDSYTVHLPAQKTIDALLVAPPAGTYSLYDRRLGLVSGTNVPGGMLAYLSYNLAAPEITSQPVNQNTGQGSSAVFDVIATGTTPLSYQWQRNNVNLVNGGGISGVTTPTLTLSNVQPAQAGAYSVVVTNIVGTTTSSNAQLSVFSLADAVDAPALTWTTGGAAPWIAQAGVTHDGSDAARSGAIPASSESWIQTTVTGPGVLSFWWKASSETNNDRLRLYLNGSTVTGFAISGETDWQFRTSSVPSGAQTYRWRYDKNSSVNGGADRAWLDQVVFTPPVPPVVNPPLITLQPTNRAVPAGTTVSFNASASGTAPLGFQWQFNGTNLANGIGVSGATTTTLTLASVVVGQSGGYSMIATNSAGSATSTVATLTVTSPPPAFTIGDAVDALSLTWQAAGDTGWIPQTAVTHDVVDAGRSGVIADGGNTRLETYVNGPGTISFWWKVSSEPINDTLRFYIGTTEMARISGEVDWEFRTFAVPSGTQILLKWRYGKNSSVVAGQDAGFVDQITFTP